MQLFDEALEAVLHHHINDALFVIDSLIKECQDDDLVRESESIARDYRAMLGFLSNGGQDPERGNMQETLTRRTLQLLYAVDYSYRMNQTKDYFSIGIEKMRQGCEDCKEMRQGVEEYDKMRVRDVDYNDFIFNTFMVGINLTGEVEKEFHDTLKAAQGKELKLLLSALTMGLWNYFDPAKLRLLSSYAPTEPRATIGLVMTAIRHEKLICKLYPKTRELYAQLMEQEEFQKAVCLVVREMFLSSQAESAQKKLHEQIFPALFDAAKDERIKLGFELDSDDGDLARLIQKREDDPLLRRKKKKMMNGISQLIDMHEEGLDINIQGFAAFSRHRFYQDLSHWFLPFDINSPYIRDIVCDEKGNTRAMAKMLLSQNAFCDIDTYGIVLMMEDVLRRSKSMGINELEEQLAELKGMNFDDEAHLLPQSAAQECRSVIQGLYRLFYKSRWKNEMPNLFSLAHNLQENSILRSAFEARTEDVMALAKLMIKHECYDQALPYLQLIDSKEGSTAEGLQLMAFCQQNLGKYRQAVNLYNQADILDSDNTWVLGQLHICYAKLEMHEQRLECLLKLEQALPESSKVTLETGLCLIQLGRYQEAVQRFYKLEIEEKKEIPSIRSIAWCSFKMNKYDVALRYYKRLFNTPQAATWEDYLNAGHTAWLLGDMVSALTFYHQYVKRYMDSNPKATKLLEPFTKDNDELLSHGLQQNDIDLMYDLIGCD